MATPLRLRLGRSHVVCSSVLTATTVADELEGTAQDLGAAGVDAYYGHGLVRPDLAIPAADDALGV